jgi:NADH-quinone oxidoreductase subunit J
VSYLFYLAAFVAVLSTAMVITCSNAMHGLLYLITSLLSVAFIFFLLGAPFVAALEAIVYAGAVMVLFVFIVMLLQVDSKESASRRAWLTPGLFVGPNILCFVLLAELGYALYRLGPTPAKPLAVVGPRQVGLSLFGPYLLGVELAGFLLLSATVGAFHLARRSNSGG